MQGFHGAFADLDAAAFIFDKEMPVHDLLRTTFSVFVFCDNLHDYVSHAG